MTSSNPLTVIDFFCGAGGFSEGFKQAGYKVLMGIDNRSDAIKTHNFNHNLNDSPIDISIYRGKDSADVNEINKLPDSDVIVGSPPCVLFSSSNKSGKSNKDEGVHLILCLLRVIAVKRFKKISILKAWVFENVPNSKKYVQDNYTFDQLNLGKRSLENGYKPSDVAIDTKGFSNIIDASLYGVPQRRKRFFCGSVFKVSNKITIDRYMKKALSLGEILNLLPKANSSPKGEIITDPIYNELSVKDNEITDHFYDTGIQSYLWEKAKFLKQNHPYMGPMSFPEDFSKTARTVLATNSTSSRESFIIKSEFNRKGNGEYRLLTIREAATLMGFPLNYQFFGRPNNKRRQVGNAVCPKIAYYYALEIKNMIYPAGHELIDLSRLKDFRKIEGFQDCNTFTEKKFELMKFRTKNAKFRRHPFKYGNMTTALTNFHPESEKIDNNWYLVCYFGTGEGFGKLNITRGRYIELREKISDKVEGIEKICRSLDVLISRFKSLNKNELQEIYERDTSLEQEMNPILVVDKIASVINDAIADKFIEDASIPFIKKTRLHKKQLAAIYILGEFLF